MKAHELLAKSSWLNFDHGKRQLNVLVKKNESQMKILSWSHVIWNRSLWKIRHWRILTGDPPFPVYRILSPVIKVLYFKCLEIQDDLKGSLGLIFKFRNARKFAMHSICLIVVKAFSASFLSFWGNWLTVGNISMTVTKSSKCND